MNVRRAEAAGVPISRPNLAGVGAMSLWSATALLMSFATAIPPVLAAALTSLVGFMIFVLYWLVHSRPLSQLVSVPLPGLLIAIAGIGGYRLLYFAAFAYAPAVDVSLTNYLWPLLTVVLSALLPGEVLRWHHFAGACLGLSGIFLLNLHEGALSQLTVGHALAFAAAVLWASYSVACRHTKRYSSDVVPISFLVTGVVFLALHLIIEPMAVHVDGVAWVAIALLGLSGGAAYFLWDVAMKHGDIQVLGALSYGIPLVSTVLLIAFGKAEASLAVLLAAILVVLGGLLAAKEALWR